MDYLKMIQDINELVESDFNADMEMKLIPHSTKYTQEEAKKMASTIAQVYGISHGLHCKSCGEKYKEDY